MELLIPGLILVALMVYVSTRIKRTAADAYAEETVETTDFRVTKPEGFIIIVSNDPNVVFAAFSKEYGTEKADAVRQVEAQIKVHPGKTLEEVRESAVLNASKLIGERHLAGRSMVIETETEPEGVELSNDFRLVEKGDRTFEFRVTALSETKELNQKYIDELLSGFEIL